MRSVTIDDVAKLAGVSIKTVSRVVNREPNVRCATREKVEAAIDELNYRPNPSARGLAGRKSYLIGLLYDNPSPSYLANLHAGLLEACRPVHYGLALCPASHTSPDLVSHVQAWLRQTQIDGVVVTPPLSDNAPLLATIRASGIPLIVVSSIGPGDVPAVLIDEELAAYEMTNLLLAAGHGSIGFIIGHPDHYCSGQRLTGYRRALSEAGRTVQENLIKQGLFDFDSGRRAAEELLSRADRPTAIFASNDDMAAGVLYEAHAMGIRVPEDLAVAGFDDTPLSRQLWPGLTTVRQPIRQIGQLAGEAILNAVNSGTVLDDARHQPVILDFELKARRSTGGAAS